MGVLDQLRSIADKVLNRNDHHVSSAPKASRVPDVTRLPDAVRINMSQKLEDYFPQTDHREKIGQILTDLGRFAVDSAVNESLKGVTGSHTFVQCFSVSVNYKSTSMKTNNKQAWPLVLLFLLAAGIESGVQVHKIVKEGLKDQPSLHLANGNDKLTLTMEQMQAQLEKMQKERNNMKLQNELLTCAKPQAQLEKVEEEIINIKQQNENLTRYAAAWKPLKEFSTEPTKGTAPSKNDVKRVMIRSRL
ncbi:hypothetical protein LguiB_030098 [Lonicera macranthoides]